MRSPCRSSRPTSVRSADTFGRWPNYSSGSRITFPRTGAAFAVHDGNFSGPVDVFFHPFWDGVREKAAAKSVEMRRQGFFGAAMLPEDELEYRGGSSRR